MERNRGWGLSRAAEAVALSGGGKMEEAAEKRLRRGSRRSRKKTRRF